MTWGDYGTVPVSEGGEQEQLEESVIETGKKSSKNKDKPVHWERSPEHRKINIPVVDGRGTSIQIPDSSGSSKLGGGLEIETHSRIINSSDLDGKQEENAYSFSISGQQTVGI